MALVNAQVYTVNPHFPLAEAIVIKGERIAFVGGNREAKAFIGAKTRVIDLNRRLVVPGFIDAHTHFLPGGLYLLGIDLRPAKSLAEFVQIVRDYVAAHRGQWITGGYWDHEQWDKPRLPDKSLLDEFSADTPILLERIDSHVAVANSRALQLAKITAATSQPAGGEIVKDPNSGEPTGILRENAIKLVMAAVPPPDKDKLYRAALSALALAKELGVTAIHDIAYGFVNYSEASEVYERLQSEGRLTCRIYLRAPIAEYQQLVNANIRAGSGSDKLWRGGVKGFVDGSLGAATAWFFQPYADQPANCGQPSPMVIDGSLPKWALTADRQRLQLAVHSIGDRANAWLIDLYAAIIAQNPNWDRRLRIEHAQHLRSADIARLAELGIIASVQPYHCLEDGVWAEKRIGRKRISEMHAFHSLLRHKVCLCFGSDWPVATLNPMAGIYAAVTRATVDGQHPNGLTPEQKITVAEAIRCYTINNAYAAFAESSLGTIEVGKFADLVVVDRDLIKINPEQIPDTKVVMTIFDGKIIFDRIGGGAASIAASSD